MSIEDLGIDFNESLYIPIRETADYQNSNTGKLDKWADPTPATPVEEPKNMGKLLLDSLRFDMGSTVHSLFKPFETVSNAALAPIAAGSETTLDAFLAAGRAGVETIQSTVDNPAPWQAEKVIERLYPSLTGGKKLTASLLLDVAADPTTIFGVGLAPKIARATGKATKKSAVRLSRAERDTEAITGLMRKADAGDLTARVELLNSVNSPKKFESFKNTMLSNLKNETKTMRWQGSFPVSKQSVAAEILIKDTRSKGSPALLVKELAGEYAATPYRFRSRYLDLNSPDDVRGYMTRRSAETETYVAESLSKATSEEVKSINVLLQGQTALLEHNISDVAARQMDNVQAFSSNMLLEDISSSMLDMLQKTQYAFDSPIDRVRFFKLLGVREQVRAEITLSTKPASKLLSFLNTRTIDGSDAIRSLRVQRAARMVPNIDPTAQRSFAQTGAMQMGADDFKNLRTFLRKSDSPQSLNRFLNTFMDDTFGDKLHRGWLHSLLSGTGTHMRNVTTNLAFAAERPFFDVAASLMDPRNMPEHIVTGMKRVVGLSEATFDSLQAMARLGPARLPANMDEWKGMHELSSRVPQLSREAINELGRNRGLEWISHHLPTHLLVGQDSWFKAVNARGQLRASAWSRAWKMAQDPAERRAIYQKLVDDPTEAMRLEAFEVAETATFQRELGTITSGWVKAIANTPGTRWIVPFLKTPANIMAEGVGHLPGVNVLNTAVNPRSKLRADLLAGGARKTAALGQLAFTNSLFLGFILAPTENFITGRGTSIDSQRRLPVPRYSIRLGDKWVSYQNNEILRWLIGVPVSLKEAFATIDWQVEDQFSEVERLTGNIISSFAGTLSDSFWMYNLGNVVDGMETAFRSGRTAPLERTLERLAGSAVPNVIKQAIKTIDPAIRSTDSALERLTASLHLPGAGDLPIDVDLLGNKRRHNFTSIWSGINLADATDDPLVLNLRKLNARLPDVSKVYMNQELSGKERMLMRSWVAAGPAGMPPLSETLTQLLASQDYLTSSLTDQREKVESLIRQYNNAALALLVGGKQ